MVISPGSLDLALLADRTRCPSCAAPLTSSVCGTCGADLGGATAARLWDVSQEILGLVRRREGLVTTLRRETAERLAAQRSVAPAVPAGAVPPAVPPGPAAPHPPGVPLPPAGPVPSPVPSLTGPSLPGTPPVGTPVPAPRPRLGVQGVLVALGALLLAVAALVFLVFAWDTLGLAGRAAVVGGITVAALAGAAWLRPRLEATAEAVGALAAVLVLADVWAVRRTGLLGADGADALTYWGAGLLVAAALLTAWALRWRVRAGSVAAAGVTPVAALLLGLATGAPTPDARAAGLGLVLAAAVTAVRRWAPDGWTAERVVLRSAAALALLLLPVAALAAFGDGRGTAAALLAAGAVAAALGAVADRGGLLARAWAGVAGVLGAAAAACVGSRVVEALDASAWGLVVPVVLAAALVLAVAAAAGPLDRAGVPARATALGALAAVALLLAADLLVLAAAAVLPLLAALLRPWASSAGTRLELVAVGGADGAVRSLDVGLAAFAAALTGALLLAAVAAGRGRAGAALPRAARWAGALPLGAAAVGALLVPAVPVGAAVAGLTLLAVAAAVVQHRVTARTAAGTLRVVAAVAGLIAVLLSWTVDVLSVPTTLAGAAGLLVARPAAPPRLRPVLLAAATAATAVAAGGAAGLLGLGVADRVTAAGVAGALLAAVTAQPLPRTATADRVAGAATGVWVGVVVVLAAFAGAGAAEPAEPGRLAVLIGALALALVAVALAPRGRAASTGSAAATVRRLRVLAAAGVPATAAAAGGFLAEAVGGRAPAGAVVAAGVVAAAALALTALVTVRPATVRDPRRAAVEAGAALAGLLTLAVTDDVDAFWVVLLLLGAGAAGVAALPDRRRVGWLALALLTASSWLRLWLGDVDVVEAYSLPPAAALLAVAALRLRRDAAADPWRALAPGAGLALAPSVVAAAGGGDLRPALLLGAGAGLVAAGLVRHRAGAVLAVAGGLAAAGTGLLRPLAAASSATGEAAAALPAADVEVWSVPAALVVLGAAVVLAARHRPLVDRLGGLGAVPVLAVLAVPTWVAAAGVPGDRAVRLAAVGGVLAVVALAAAARPLVRASAGAVLLTWPAAVLAGAGAGVAALTAWLLLPDVPFEVFSAGAGGLAVALGALRMAAVPALRSWPALGGGLVLALAPTVVLAAGGDLWRVLGVVVAGGAVVAAGAARRLQAPVAVGGAALAAHALVQVAPFVAELTTSQWRWVVFAAVGAGLLVLGATYERRLAELRRARTALSTLR